MPRASSWLPTGGDFDPNYPVTAWGKRAGGKRSARTGGKATDPKKNATCTNRATDRRFRASGTVVLNPSLDALIAQEGLVNGVLLFADPAKSAAHQRKRKPHVTRERFLMPVIREEAAEVRAVRESQFRFIEALDANPTPMPVFKKVLHMSLTCSCGHPELAHFVLPDGMTEEEACVMQRFHAQERKCERCLNEEAMAIEHAKVKEAAE
jgi:hypothetical protein